MPTSDRPTIPAVAPPVVAAVSVRTDWPAPVAAAVVVMVLLGVALRIAGMRQGLPDFVEEAIPFRWALAMWANPDGAIDWNPHHFIYPSLTVYLHLGLQHLHATLGRWAGLYTGPADYHLAFQIDPTPMVLLARSLGIAADAVSLVLVARLGERMRRGAGLVAALVMACSPIMIATSRIIFTDPIMLALALAALERMQRYRADGGVARLLLVSALTGLAIGAKYPAAVLLLPLAWTLSRAHRGRGLLRAGPIALLTAGLTFLASSPFVILDRARFLRDVGFDRVLASEGLLGASGPSSGWHTLGTLGRDLGPMVAMLAVVGWGRVLWRDRRLPGAAATTLAGMAFLVPVVVSPLRFERYLLGAIPAAALLAGLAASFVLTRVTGRARAIVGVTLAFAIALPALASALAMAADTPLSTQRQAFDWCAAHIGHESLILTENYGPPLLTRQGAAVAAESPLLERASAGMRARFLARPWFSAVRIPTLVAGTCVVTLHPAGRAPVDVTVFPHASDFNNVLYDPHLLAGVDYVITSSAMRGRFTADSARYSLPCAFYRLLDSTAQVAARFDSRPDVSGPAIVIYRLAGPRFRAPEGLGPWWWTEHIPLEYRLRAAAVLSPGVPMRTLATGPGGEPASWVLGLKEFYDSQISFFAQDLTYNLVELDRPEPARQLMRASLAIDPGNEWACLLLVEISRALGDWPGARTAFERMAAANPTRRFDAALLAEYAEALARTGEPVRAAVLRDSLARAGAPQEAQARGPQRR